MTTPAEAQEALAVHLAAQQVWRAIAEEYRSKLESLGRPHWHIAVHNSEITCSGGQLTPEHLPDIQAALALAAELGPDVVGQILGRY